MHLPEPFRSTIINHDKGLQSWIDSWLVKAYISSHLSEALFLEHVILHSYWYQNPAIFELSYDKVRAIWALHAHSSLFDETVVAQTELQQTSYCLGHDSFFILSSQDSLIEFFKNRHAQRSYQLCSTQVCLGPSELQLISRLPHTPSENETHFYISMTFVAHEMERHCLYHCSIIQPKNRYSLSYLVSLLENFGLQVKKNYFYDIKDKPYWEINFFELRSYHPTSFITDQITGQKVAQLMETALMDLVSHQLESDGLYQLIALEGFNTRHVMLFRAFLRYLWQIKCPISFSYASDLLISHSAIAADIKDFFEWRMSPSRCIENDQKKCLQKYETLMQRLDAVVSADADRLLRKMIELVNAIVRTNYYQKNSENQFKSWLSLKIDPKKLTDLPLPIMAHEIFVYSHEMEGIHLRTSNIARGGIRWSDRVEDYRTEVLGLAKAQQAKNSIIVPSGAKGGFIVKRKTSPEEQIQTAAQCYDIFIKGLLDVTDNLHAAQIIPPALTCCWDQADPYLVVAADKGTASFSDRANAIAADYGFWLGDAFASGGSKGYDHKKLGITAKGAFISLKHHLRDAQINHETHPISAIGIGDMSGDVFGNGALQIPQIKWLAAFNHRHIFLDPEPRPESADERQRLFIKGRGSWNDFNQELISEGGGVFRRDQKSIALSPQVQKMLQTTQATMSPDNLIAHILRMKVDVIFNGGIGTYIKSAAESHADVGDRQNDDCRVNAEELQASIIIEGGNLGVTQRARIAFAQHKKGRINTDTLDNSAGVDCSDHEVNIKILLQLARDSHQITSQERDVLLASLAETICQSVLKHNSYQNEIISILEHTAGADLLLHSQIIADLAQKGRLNRQIDLLPTPKQIEERLHRRQGLSRPELITLLACVKIDLKEQLTQCDLSKILFKNQYLYNYFPAQLSQQFGQMLERHPLADKIIIATLVNNFVDELGAAFYYRLLSETQASCAAIFSVYSWVREILQITQRLNTIRLLPLDVAPAQRYDLNTQMQRYVYRVMRWVLKNDDLQDLTQRRGTRLKQLIASYSDFLQSLAAEQRQELSECPETTHILRERQIASWEDLCFFTRFVPLFAIERWAPEESSQWPAIFECYDKISAMLRLHQIHQVINHLTVHSSWDALGRSQLREKLEQLHVAITQKFYKNSSWIVDIAWFLSFWNQQFDAYLALPSRYFVETFTLINQLELLLKMR